MTIPQKTYWITLLLIFLTGSSTLAQEESTKSLDGTWKVIFDEKNEGREAKWMKSEIFAACKDQKDVQVPSCWEELNEDYEGVAFYQKKFSVPESWNGKVIHLTFGAVNYLAEVYLNDEVLGYHEGGFTPFSFNVEHLVNFDEENVLTLRIVGPITISDKAIDGMGQMETPQWRGAYTGGIWQSVTLSTSGRTYFEDIFVEPKISDDTATVHYQLNNVEKSWRTVILESTVRSVREPNKVVATSKQTLTLRPGINKKRVVLHLDNPSYWSPDDPFLYTLESKLVVAGKISDSEAIRFGMRAFTLQGKTLVLNGKPLFLKATFFEGLYPVKLAAPDSREMMVKEIMLAKQAGFNMIRPWRKPPLPAWLDLADELGVLVVGSLSVECMGKPNATPYLARRVENELRETVLRDRNHASIVQWELFNELHQPVLMNMLHSMSMVARELDPTRLILDESGGWAEGANLYLPYEFEPTKFNDIHTYPGPNITQSRFNDFLVIAKTQKEKQAMGLVHSRSPGRNVKPGLTSFVSELGYGSLPDLAANNEEFKKKGNLKTPPYKYHKRLHEETEKVLKESGLNKIFGSASAFYLKQQEVHGMANLRMMEAARSNPDVNGYCIHALTAGDWIIGAGLLDIWRNPKKAVYEGTKAGNQPQLAILRILPRNVYADRGTSLVLKGVNEFNGETIAYAIEIRDAAGNSVWKSKGSATLKSGVSELFDTKIDTTAMRGNYQVKALLTNGEGKTIAATERSFDVFAKEDLATKKMKIAVVDVAGTLSRFMKNRGFEPEKFSEKTTLDTLVVVGEKAMKNNAYLKSIEDLNGFVAKGGKAIYLEVPAKTVKRVGPSRSNVNVGVDYLPSRPLLKSSIGLWDGILHMAHDHPVFKGLPVKQPLTGIYENLAPRESFVSLEGDMMVNTVAFDRFENQDDRKRNYVGPGAAWWASDLVGISHGKGKMMLSTLNLLNNLDRDPVAEKLLFNMIDYLK